MKLRYIGILLGLLAARPVSAGTNDNAKIVLHLRPAAGPGCTLAGNPPACANLVTSGLLTPNGYYAYVLVANGDATAGVAGVSFGINYQATIGQGVDVFGWTNCADLQFPEPGWPASNRGNLVTWNTDTRCQRIEPGGPGTGVMAVIGYLYVSAYTADDLKIIPRLTDGKATVGDCAATESNLTTAALGFARFASTLSPGFNPCTGPPPPPPTTPTCSVTGQQIVIAGTTGLTYSVQTNVPASSYLWSVTGNATISGPATNSSVTVDAGAAGSFSLSVVYQTLTAGSGTCSMNVNVQPQVTCSINGPAIVTAGTTNLYGQGTNVGVSSYMWSVTGSGTIAGSAAGPSVQVTAGAAGSYNVHLVVTAGIATGACDQAVTVNVDPGCAPCGPGQVYEAELATYTAPAGYAYAWSVTGNGTIVGPADQSSAQVRAGNPGSFTVTVTLLSSPPQPVSKTVTVIASPPPPSYANQSAGIAVHLRPAGSGNPCSGPVPRCFEIQTSGLLDPHNYYAFILVTNGYSNGYPRSGIAGLQFGIQYDNATGSGVDVLAWTLCASLEFPSTGWPESGGGNLVTWDSMNACQASQPDGQGTGVIARAGYFYLTAHTPDNFMITPRPVDGFAKVADCYGQESTIAQEGVIRVPSRLGFAHFGASISLGYNPCGLADPVVPTTWSGVKTLYGAD